MKGIKNDVRKSLQNPENKTSKKADDLLLTEYYEGNEIQGNVCNRVQK